ncbi:MAG: hypothetical protein NT144_14205 [Bacteroidia bacterium]|nr:hypothetical protein [Bacteroidia bacterium]
MQRVIHIIFVYFILTFPANSFAQDSLSFKGQISTWMLYNGGNDLPVYMGGRYIPQMNYTLPLKNDHKIDFEASVNINGSAGFNPFDSLRSTGQLKPYRLWARYSTRQFEIRAGLQKINFGSASLLRPLMWFDQVDPRDPLHLTDGVWGVLGRYYFLNNANIWLWGLYGNKDPKGWEFAGTNSHYPEVGGRIQLPVHTGEVALSYHYRIADTRNLGELVPKFSEIQENRIGFDIKLDLVVGFWLEGSWTTKNKELGMFTNQEILNAGIDYTFGIGNGFNVVYEQLLTANDEKAFNFQNTTLFSLLSLSYPIGLFDNISGIVYYDWKNRNAYNFLNWQKQFNHITLYLMGYWNPEKYNIPAQGSDQTLFAGKGIQIMLVLNH